MQFCANILTACIIYNALSASKGVKYYPTWESLDTRPLPAWYDNAKIGIFVHWGVYSVPSFGPVGGTSSEWFWAYWKGGNLWHSVFMNENYPPGFTYQEFAKEFKAEFYNPESWAKLFQKSGAKYVVFTSKHHDGYALWPSTYSFGWNVQDVGPHKDVLGAFAKAIRTKTSLKFGLYYSLYEWYHPLYLADKKSGFVRNNFIVNKVAPEMMEIVKKYAPDVIWADGDWEALESYFLSKQFLAWLYNDSPVRNTVVVNDRWGNGIPCHHGDFYTCTDRFNPGVIQSHKWENAMTIDRNSWGFRRNAHLGDYLTTKELLVTMTQTISCGGNILINVGPTSDGRIAPIFEERLLDLGNWLSINGEAIYGTRPWLFQNDSIGNTWYTTKRADVYAITLDWPCDNVLELNEAVGLFATENVSVTLLGNAGQLEWKLVDGKVYILFPDRAEVISKWSWVVRINIPSYYRLIGNKNIFLNL